MTTEDPVLAWFREWLTWSHLPAAQRVVTPEPVAPDRRTTVSGRAQEAACGSRPETTEDIR
jgi:hypothetical protein